MASYQYPEQRAIIKFCCELGYSPTKTYEMIKKSSAGKKVSRTQVFEWLRRFREGRQSLEDDSREGRRRSVDATFVETIKDVILSDRRVTIRDVCDVTGYSYGSVQRVITEQLNMSKVSARWIPRLLMDDHKTRRVQTSKQFLLRYRREGEHFLDRIVTTDESWFYLFDPETKEQSRQWKSPNTPNPKKAKVCKTVGKQMYIFFAYYGKVLRTDLTRALRRKRPGINLDDVILHQDNATCHTAVSTMMEIGLLGFELVDYPAYSPYLAPMDFQVFPTVKSVLKGHRFDTFQELSFAIRNGVSQLKPDWYLNMFNQWLRRHEKCVDANGDCIEK